ncbi:hypothetical protein FJU08_03690 [Martelella alba]|uniref:Uncharacterized protein n=1 Tax=Martelella alba TaxID=2590451 RepID=A0A506UG14_9HYPH|nr:hypothetical protein [Martelella alba]TPW32124.1 hypothetical protein FJU08_03690 [Martelella alba]
MKSVFFRIMHASEFWRVFNIWLAINMVVPRVVYLGVFKPGFHGLPHYIALAVLMVWLNFKCLDDYKALMLTTIVLNLLSLLLLGDFSFPSGLYGAFRVWLSTTDWWRWQQMNSF